MFTERQSVSVVEELNMVVDKACKFLEVAAVDGSEKLGVKHGAGLAEFGLRLDVLKGRDTLRAGAGGRHCQQRQQQQGLLQIKQLVHAIPFV